MVCVAPFLGFMLRVVALVMLQRGGWEESRGGSLHQVAPTVSTSHRARAAGTRERGVGGRGRKRESVSARASPVCTCGLHHRIVFTVYAGVHALMERIKKKNPDKSFFPSDLSPTVVFQM